MSIMSTLKLSDVRHVAKLAKLKLTKEEEEKFQKQLSEVVDYIDELKKVDTSAVKPTSQTTGLENITREDKVEPTDTLTQDEALSGTEKVHNGYFVVPRVFEESRDT